MNFVFGRNAQLLASLDELFALDGEALEAMQNAIARVDDEPLSRDTLMSFKSDLERHRRELDVAIRAHGGTPGTYPGPRVAIARTPELFELPSTTAVLRVLKGNQDVVVRVYQNVLRRMNAHPDTLDLVRRSCNDALRHRAWIAARVAAFSRTSREPSDSRTSAF